MYSVKASRDVPEAVPEYFLTVLTDVVMCSNGESQLAAIDVEGLGVVGTGSCNNFVPSVRVKVWKPGVVDRGSSGALVRGDGDLGSSGVGVGDGSRGELCPSW